MVTQSLDLSLQQNHPPSLGSTSTVKCTFEALEDFHFLTFSPAELVKPTGLFFLCHKEKGDKIIKPAKSYVNHDLGFVLV